MQNQSATPQDKFIFIFLAIILLFVGIIADAFLLVLIIPSIMVIAGIYFSSDAKRDEYLKAKRAAVFAVLFVSIINFLGYFLYDDFFNALVFNQDSIVYLSAFMLLASMFIKWFSKRAIPVSFLEDDDRIVQETMYENDEDIAAGYNLKNAFLYRSTRLKDGNGQIFDAKDIHKAKGELTPVELDISDIEIEALNGKGELKFYYEKLIFDMYNDFITNNDPKTQEKFEKYYGYNFTIDHGLTTEEDFVKALKETSLFYYRVYQFIKKDANNKDTSIEFRFDLMYIDNFHCLEFVLVTMFLMIRQYVNFPTGNLGMYVKTPKDKHFLGLLASLPANFYATNTTSSSASGVAYYYTYYAINKKRFQNIKETIKRYVIEV